MAAGADRRNGRARPDPGSHRARLPRLLHEIARSLTIDPLEATVLTIEDLPAGTYTFWCTFSLREPAPHYAQGMVGTLTVNH